MILFELDTIFLNYFYKIKLLDEFIFQQIERMLNSVDCFGIEGKTMYLLVGILEEFNFSLWKPKFGMRYF
jgi:hypothetical protein